MVSARQFKPPLFAMAIVVGVVPALASAAEPANADAGTAAFKAEIRQLTDNLATASHGVVKWLGSDPYQIRADGNTLVAVINHARLAVDIEMQKGELGFGTIEVRRTVQPGGKTIDFAIGLPNTATLTEAGPKGPVTLAKLALNQPKADVVIDAQNRLTQASAVSFASARIDLPTTGAWIRTGPLSMESKIIAEPNGGWRGPSDFQLKQIEFFSPKGTLGGVIGRIAYQGKSAGPSRAALEKLRLALNKLRSEHPANSKAYIAALLAMLPTLPAAMGSAGVDMEVEGVSVHGPTGEMRGSLKKIDFALKISGLDGTATALRLTFHQDGLSLPAALVAGAPVPHRIVIDLGVENLSNQALRAMLKTVAAVPHDGQDAAQHKQQLRQQLLGAAAMLEPVFRIYDIAVDTKEIGLDLSGQASGSPLSPKGYSAAGDLIVRGFGGLAGLLPSQRLGQYLPLLRTMAISEKAADGTPRLRFHLASGPKNWFTINGNDVRAWFAPPPSAPGQPRLLRLASPPLTGADVKRVQAALAAAKIAAPDDGVYTGATAAAVARFQKEEGLNTNGVVDAATRAKLGIKPAAAAPGPRKTGNP